MKPFEWKFPIWPLVITASVFACMFVRVWAGAQGQSQCVTLSLRLNFEGCTDARTRTDRKGGRRNRRRRWPGREGGREVGRPFAYDVRTEGGEGVGIKSEDSTDRLCEWDTDKGEGIQKSQIFANVTYERPPSIGGGGSFIRSFPSSSFTH